MGKLLLGRIGWMTFYKGPQPGDEAPTGGGAYNEKKQGHEMFNFRAQGARVRGYFASPSYRIDLKRIDSAASDETDSIKGVTVVFFAPDNRSGGSGQVVVGWYRKAVVYREYQEMSARSIPDSGGWRGGKVAYCVEAAARDAVLLPTAGRSHVIPRGKGATGQSNVFYTLDEAGKLKHSKWLPGLENFIRGYDGPNLMTSPEAEAEDEAVGTLEDVVAASQGFQSDPRVRRAIEHHAVQRAEAWLRKRMPKGGTISRHGKPYDLLWEKGKQRRYVEVKGAQGSAEKIVLTRNEVEFARKNHDSMVLYVLHSIKIKRDGNHVAAIGGKEAIVTRWSPKSSGLQPLQFSYDLAAHRDRRV